MLPWRLDGSGTLCRRRHTGFGNQSWQKFRFITFPLLSPTSFFLLVVNLIYAFFDTFGIIHAVTGGGPGRATETLVFKVYNDGFVNQQIGPSAAQSRSETPRQDLKPLCENRAVCEGA
jgi:hypothetical protein